MTTDLVPLVHERLGDEAPQVRAMAVWAASRLGGPEAFEHLAARHLPGEVEPEVLTEWRRAVSQTEGAPA